MRAPAQVTTPDPRESGHTDIFISYSRTDEEFVERRLQRALVERGKECWIDLEDILPADDWRAAIAAGIDESLCFAAVISEAWLSSQECARELAHAQAVNKRLVPILREAVDVDAVPDALRQMNWIMMRDGDDFDAQLVRLVQAMETDLDWTHRHARLNVRANDWEHDGHDRGALLRGRELDEAEGWLAAAASHAEQPTALQVSFIVAGREARSRMQRARLLAVTVALAISVGLGLLALDQRDRARTNEQTAIARQIAAQAQTQLAEGNAATAALLGAEALRRRPLVDARAAALKALPSLDRQRGVLNTPAPVVTLAMSADASAVLAGGFDDRLRVWSAASLRLTASFATGLGGDDGPDVIALSSDGSLAAASEGPMMRIFATRDPARAVGAPPRLHGSDPSIVSLDFVSAGRQLLWATADGRAGLWDIARKRLVRRWHVDRGRLGNGAGPVALRADGKTFARAVGAGVGIWQLAVAGAPRHNIRAPGAVDVALTPAGRSVLVGKNDGYVHEIEIATGHDRRTQIPASDGFSGSPTIELAGDGRTVVASDGVVATGTSTGISLWDLRSGRRRADPLRGRTASTGVFALDASGTRLVVGADEYELALLDIGSSGGLGRVLDRGGRQSGGLAFLDDSTLVSGRGNGVQRWELSSREPVAQRLGATDEVDDPVAGIARTPDGRLLVAAESGSLTAYDPRARMTPRQLIAGGGGAVGGGVGGVVGSIVVAHAARGQLAVFNKPNEAIRVVDDRTGRVVRRLKGPDDGVFSLALSPDGRIAASGSFSSGARLWKVADGRSAGPRIGAPDSQVTALAFSPDGSRLASGGGNDDARIRLNDVARPRARAVTMTGHTAAVTTLAFSPDGQTLASGSEDRRVRLWDVASGSLLTTLDRHRAPITNVAFSPDGRTLATLDNDGGLRTWSGDVWTADASRLRTIACRATVNGLARDRWKALLPGVAYRATCGR